jgi:hypothetical protein
VKLSNHGILLQGLPARTGLTGNPKAALAKKNKP